MPASSASSSVIPKRTRRRRRRRTELGSGVGVGGFIPRVWLWIVFCITWGLPQCAAAAGRKRVLAFLARPKMSIHCSSSTRRCALSREWDFYHLTQPIASTQEEAKKRLLERKNANDRCLAVVADQQEAGRGTQGRQWKGATGNLYLTLALSMEAIPRSLLSLLPLQVGITTARQIHLFLERHNNNHPPSFPRITVKWPNDVLMNDAKVAGTLIESVSMEGTYYFLIGVGMNVATAPLLEGLPGKQVRRATCLAEYCDNDNPLPPTAHVELGRALAQALVDWTVDLQRKDEQAVETFRAQVVQDFRQWTEFGKSFELRGQVVQEDQGGYEGEVVEAVDICDDGQLLVRGANGQLRRLVADYLF